jgi:hypothetical protein
MRHHIGTLLTSIFPQARCLNTHPKRGGCRLCNTLKDRYPEPRDYKMWQCSCNASKKLTKDCVTRCRLTEKNYYGILAPFRLRKQQHKRQQHQKIHQKTPTRSWKKHVSKRSCPLRAYAKSPPLL